MAKKKDPFLDFAETMLSGTKVSDTEVPAEALEHPFPSPEPAAQESGSEADGSLPSPAPAPDATSDEQPETDAKGLRANHKAFTVYIKNDLLQKIRTAHYKYNLTAKSIINQALEEYFEKHKGLL